MNRQEYAQYKARVSEFIEREGLSFLSTSTAETCGGVEGDPWYSKHSCECCGGLTGSREYLYARDKQNDTVCFEICEDCVYYLEYGKLDDAAVLALDAEPEVQS